MSRTKKFVNNLQLAYKKTLELFEETKNKKKKN